MTAPSPYGLKVIDNCFSCHLREDRLFCNLPPEALRAFDALKQLATYPKGATLFVEGQAPRGVYVVCNGQVKLSMSSREGRTLIVRMAENGEVVGLPATVSELPYEVTAETQTPCQVNFIRKSDFLAFLRSNPDAMLRVAQELSTRYYSACRELRMLGLTESVSERLAGMLLDWSERHGDRTPEGIRLRVSLTQEEIAQQVGTARETVSRLISDLKKKKIIAVRGSIIVIQDAVALKQIANV